jgi:hypothetical protein
MFGHGRGSPAVNKLVISLGKNQQTVGQGSDSNLALDPMAHLISCAGSCPGMKRVEDIEKERGTR